MRDSRSPYEPRGFEDERKKRMRSFLKRMENGQLSPHEKLNPYDLDVHGLIMEIRKEDGALD